ncbi:(2Fe-2S) ferredoxin domain-containing protein [Streptomyces sp. BI20]|uniref:(2Fe-2S) ferredoxin domain-containing protein n=1 Tax=Streptomyces sp. BI20 TaxID=3403460 RepID=UPI003C711969
MTWTRPSAPRPCTLVVCRGCCCGTARKRPGTDHEDQLARLRAATTAPTAPDGAPTPALRVTDCLGPCAEANVLVVQPSAAARRAGARAVWLGGVLDTDLTDTVADWARAGGPGAAPLPEALAEHRIDPPETETTSARARTRKNRTRGRR